MADPEESQSSSSSLNPVTTSKRTAGLKRKGYFAKRDATKVCLLEAFDRWKVVKEENDLKSDKQVAEMLLDLYMKESTKRTW